MPLFARKSTIDPSKRGGFICEYLEEVPSPPPPRNKNKKRESDPSSTVATTDRKTSTLEQQTILCQGYEEPVECMIHDGSLRKDEDEVRNPHEDCSAPSSSRVDDEDVVVALPVSTRRSSGSTSHEQRQQEPDHPSDQDVELEPDLERVIERVLGQTSPQTKDRKQERKIKQELKQKQRQEQRQIQKQKQEQSQQRKLELKQRQREEKMQKKKEKEEKKEKQRKEKMEMQKVKDERKKKKNLNDVLRQGAEQQGMKKEKEDQLQKVVDNKDEDKCETELNRQACDNVECSTKENAESLGAEQPAQETTDTPLTTKDFLAEIFTANVCEGKESPLDYVNGMGRDEVWNEIFKDTSTCAASGASRMEDAWNQLLQQVDLDRCGNSGESQNHVVENTATSDAENPNLAMQESLLTRIPSRREQAHARTSLMARQQSLPQHTSFTDRTQSFASIQPNPTSNTTMKQQDRGRSPRRFRKLGRKQHVQTEESLAVSSLTFHNNDNVSQQPPQQQQQPPTTPSVQQHEKASFTPPQQVNVSSSTCPTAAPCVGEKDDNMTFNFPEFPTTINTEFVEQCYQFVENGCLDMALSVTTLCESLILYDPKIKGDTSPSPASVQVPVSVPASEINHRRSTSFQPSLGMSPKKTRSTLSHRAATTTDQIQIPIQSSASSPPGKSLRGRPSPSSLVSTTQRTGSPVVRSRSTGVSRRGGAPVPSTDDASPSRRRNGGGGGGGGTATVKHSNRKSPRISKKKKKGMKSRFGNNHVTKQSKPTGTSPVLGRSRSASQHPVLRGRSATRPVRSKSASRPKTTGIKSDQ